MMFRPPICFPCLSVCSLLSVVLCAEEPEWTGWRGTERDARVMQFEAPAKWPTSLERGWKVEVGSGYATPLVVGDRIYQHAREGGEEVLWCLDRKTGKAHWRKSVAVEFEPGRGGERHGLGPKSTPTVADGRVFTLSITGHLAAWSTADGELLWTRDFREQFEPAHPYWGTATSPVVDGGRLFVHTGSCEDGALFCIDPETGKDLWVRDEDPNCYSSPLVETIEGVRQLIEFNHAGLCGLDAADGRLLWKSSYPHRGNRQNPPTPVRVGELLVVGGEDRGMFAVRPHRTGDEWQAERVWFHRDVSLDMSSPVANEGLVYGFSHFKMGQIFCLNPADGEVLWAGETRMGDNGQFLSLPGHVLALTDDGTLRVLRANREKFDVLRSYQVAEHSAWTAPALVGDDLLIKDGKHLVLWRLPGGKETD